MSTTNIYGPINDHTGPHNSKADGQVGSSEGSGMETDQAEQLDTLLALSAQVLNINQEAQEKLPISDLENLGIRGSHVLIRFKPDML